MLYVVCWYLLTFRLMFGDGLICSQQVLNKSQATAVHGVAADPRAVQGDCACHSML
jgi:hypothetical protein